MNAVRLILVLALIIGALAFLQSQEQEQRDLPPVDHMKIAEAVSPVQSTVGSVPAYATRTTRGTDGECYITAAGGAWTATTSTATNQCVVTPGYQ